MAIDGLLQCILDNGIMKSYSKSGLFMPEKRIASSVGIILRCSRECLCLMPSTQGTNSWLSLYFTATQLKNAS